MPVKEIELTAIEIIDMTDVAYDNLFNSSFWKFTKISDNDIKELVS